MIMFDQLFEALKRNELIMISGGFCRWHLRQDGQITIYEIISNRRGAGQQMLRILKEVPGAKSIFAKCPTDLEANGWYERRGFELEDVETTRTGRMVNCWRLNLK
jgi:hypothetical protein